jgi:predicted CoA-binding protein
MPDSQRNCAVIGDVFNREKWANKSLRAHRMAGYHCFPVHPSGGEVEGMLVYTSVSQIPDRLNRITVYLRPSLALAVLDEIAGKGCDELWLNPGVYTPEVIQRAESLGLSVRAGCSIIDAGVSPGSL